MNSMRPHPWHPEDIKAEVRKRGSTLVGIARKAGFSRQAGTRVLRRPWPAMERAVAEFLNVHPAQIWPDRYDEKGNPLIERSTWKDSGRQGRNTAQTSERKPRAVA